VRYNLYITRVQLLSACELLFVVAKISYLIVVFLRHIPCLARIDCNVTIPVTIMSPSDFLSSYCHILPAVSLVSRVTFCQLYHLFHGSYSAGCITCSTSHILPAISPVPRVTFCRLYHLFHGSHSAGCITCSTGHILPAVSLVPRVTFFLISLSATVTNE
jgi:hypothetical protein